MSRCKRCCNGNRTIEKRKAKKKKKNRSECVFLTRKALFRGTLYVSDRLPLLLYLIQLPSTQGTSDGDYLYIILTLLSSLISAYLLSLLPQSIDGQRQYARSWACVARSVLGAVTRTKRAISLIIGLSH